MDGVFRDSVRVRAENALRNGQSQYKKKGKLTRCRDKMSNGLHTHVVMIILCCLVVIDAACVIGQILCDILIIQDKLKNSDDAAKNVVGFLKDKFPEHLNETHPDITLPEIVKKLKHSSLWNSTNMNNLDNITEFNLNVSLNNLGNIDTNNMNVTTNILSTNQPSVTKEVMQSIGENSKPVVDGVNIVNTPLSNNNLMNDQPVGIVVSEKAPKSTPRELLYKPRSHNVVPQYYNPIPKLKPFPPSNRGVPMPGPDLPRPPFNLPPYVQQRPKPGVSRGELPPSMQLPPNMPKTPKEPVIVKTTKPQPKPTDLIKPGLPDTTSPMKHLHASIAGSMMGPNHPNIKATVENVPKISKIVKKPPSQVIQPRNPIVETKTVPPSPTTTTATTRITSAKQEKTPSPPSRSQNKNKVVGLPVDVRPNLPTTTSKSGSSVDPNKLLSFYDKPAPHAAAHDGVTKPPAPHKFRKVKDTDLIRHGPPPDMVGSLDNNTMDNTLNHPVNPNGMPPPGFGPANPPPIESGPHPPMPDPRYPGLPPLPQGGPDMLPFNPDMRGPPNPYGPPFPHDPNRPPNPGGGMDGFPPHLPPNLGPGPGPPPGPMSGPHNYPPIEPPMRQGPPFGGMPPYSGPPPHMGPPHMGPPGPLSGQQMYSGPPPPMPPGGPNQQYGPYPGPPNPPHMPYPPQGPPPPPPGRFRRSLDEVSDVISGWLTNPDAIHSRHRRGAGGKHAEHTLLEELTHIFHLTSMAVLSFLVLVTLLKIFSMGRKFIHHKLEVFDAFVVVVSWALDVAFYEGIWAHPGPNAATILLFLLPWRVIRIVNSFVMVMKERGHVKVKLTKQKLRTANKKITGLKLSIERYRMETRSLQGLCRKYHAPEPEINACAPVWKRRRSSLVSMMEGCAKIGMATAMSNSSDPNNSDEEVQQQPHPANRNRRIRSTDSGVSSVSMQSAGGYDDFSIRRDSSFARANGYISRHNSSLRQDSDSSMDSSVR